MEMELLHDLRLCLQVNLSSVRLLKAGLREPGFDPEEYLDMMAESTEQMCRMLEDALPRGGAARWLSAPPTGAEREPQAAVDAGALLRGLCRRCGLWADERGVLLSYSQNVEPLTLCADGALLSRAALNLIMNALRFTPAGGRVAVNSRALGDYVEISVSDQGPGIAPERLPLIFLPGETDGGHGFGLPSAMTCARAMGGSILVDTRPGGGSTFTLRLPVRSARAS